MRAANYAIDERWKKEKDDKEKKWWAKERDNAQQQINLLEGELRGEKDLNVTVEAVTARLTVEVNQR